MNNSTKAHVFILLANIIYGLNYTIAKNVLEVIPPFGLVFTRVGISLIIFLVIYVLFIQEKIENKDHFKLILCALFGVALNQLLFIKGLDVTSEIHASLIMITTPLLVLIIAWFVIQERITSKKIIGIITGGIGVYVLVISGNKDIDSPSNILGDLMIMANAAFYAIFLVIAKPLMHKYSPFTISFWIFFYGMIVIFPIGIRQFLQVRWMELPQDVFISWLYVVIAQHSLHTYLIHWD